MAIYSNKRAIRRAKEAAGLMQSAGIKAMETAQTEKARSISAERTKLSVLSALGQEGTYGPNATGTNLSDSDSVFMTEAKGLARADQSLAQFGPNAKVGEMGMIRKGSKRTGDWTLDPDTGKWGQADVEEKTQAIYQKGLRQGIVDPDAYTDAISNSALFRIQSQQVAEAEQLLNQEGPLWDRLNNSTYGVISETAALALRDTMRQIKNSMAKGGSARRTGANEFRVIQAAERARYEQGQATFKANLQLRDTIVSNADRVTRGAQSFVDSLPLLNESYRTAMLENAKLSVQTFTSMATITKQAYDVRMSQQAVDFWENLAEGVINLVVSVVSYGALSGAMSQASASKATTGTSGGQLEGAGGSSNALMGAAAGVAGQYFGGGSAGLGSFAGGLGLGPQTAVSSVAY